MPEGPDETPPVSRTLAAFIARSRPGDLPDAVMHAARRSLLNFFATAFAGAGDVAVATAASTLADFAGRGEASLIGRAERVDALTAAFLNAAAGNVHDFDDTHLRTVIHPTAPVAPALLALAERRRIAGPDFLHALALGIETACRVGNAVSPDHYARGWHITSTCGIFGAAVAVGKLLGLDEQRLLWALGGASAQASGLVETLGFMAKSVGVGGSARGGLLAALLAERGMDGPARPLEGVRGFLTVTGADPRLGEVTDDLGNRWEVLRNIHKPYPCGIVLNAVIDGCLELRTRRPASVAEIASITLRGHPLLRQRADRPDVMTGREAQVSAQHAVAACLIFGAAGLDQFSDTAVRDPRVLELRKRVRIESVPDVPVADVRITVEDTDGTTEEIVVHDARGTDGRPLTDGEIEDKFRSLASLAPACVRAGELIEAVWTLDGREDVGTLMNLARPAAGEA